MARGRLVAPGLDRRADGGAGPPGRLGPDVRPAARAHLDRGGARALPRPVRSRRRPRRGVAPDGRLAQPDRSDDGAGRRRPQPRRGDRHHDPGDGHRRRGAAGPAPGHPRRHGPRPHHLRRRRERGRHVRPRDRADGRRQRARRADGAPVRADPPVAADPQGPADDARPRSPRVLPGGGRWPRRRWLRAGPRPVERGRRHPAHLQQHPPAARLGPLPPPERGGHDAGAVPGRRRGDAAHQRPRGLHARRGVHPGRERGVRLLRRGRVLRPRHRRRRAATGR